MSNAEDVRLMSAFCENLKNAGSLYKWKLKDDVMRDSPFALCDKLEDIPFNLAECHFSCHIY